MHLLWTTCLSFIPRLRKSFLILNKAENFAICIFQHWIPDKYSAPYPTSHRFSFSLTIKWNLCQINDRGELLLSRPSITAAGANAVQTSQGSSRDKEKRIRNCIQSSSQSPDSHTVISNPIPFNLKTDVWKYLPFPGGLWINNKPVSFELKFKYFISK